jgi:hypothetical protein
LELLLSRKLKPEEKGIFSFPFQFLSNFANAIAQQTQDPEQDYLFQKHVGQVIKII